MPLVCLMCRQICCTQNSETGAVEHPAPARSLCCTRASGQWICPSLLLHEQTKPSRHSLNHIHKIEHVKNNSKLKFHHQDISFNFERQHCSCYVALSFSFLLPHKYLRHVNTGAHSYPSPLGTYSFSQSGFEVVEDEVRVLFGHGADLGYVMPHHYVLQREGGGRSVGQVHHRQAGRLASMLVNLHTTHAR